MSVAAFVLAILTLFGNAAAVYWLYLRQIAEKTTRLHDVAEMERALAGRIQILESRPVRLAPVEQPEKKREARPRSWQTVRDEIEAGAVGA